MTTLLAPSAPTQPRSYCYDELAKAKQTAKVRKFYREALKMLPGFDAKVHFNPGGIAVWGETYLHLHINLCREDMSVIGGHLNECRVSATCEMFVRKLEGAVERKLDEAVTGLNLYKFL